jgi:hypothetical protein
VLICWRSAKDLQASDPRSAKENACLLKLVVLITSRQTLSWLRTYEYHHEPHTNDKDNAWYMSRMIWWITRSIEKLFNPSIHRLLLVSLRKRQETQDRQVSIRKYSEIPSWWETNSEYYDDACKLRSITEGIYLSIYTSRMETTEHHHWSYVRSITQQ